MKQVLIDNNILWLSRPRIAKGLRGKEITVFTVEDFEKANIIHTKLQEKFNSDHK